MLVRPVMRAIEGRTGRQEKCAAAIFLAAVVTLFLWQPIAQQGWYGPEDILQFSRAFRVDGYTGVAKNPLLSDPVEIAHPWALFDRQSIWHGSLPTWNPDNGEGVPQLANDQSAVFGLSSLPFYILPFRLALIASAALKLWPLGWFTYLFLRRHVRAAGALAGAVVFMFGGYHIVWLNWAVVGASLTLPMGLWAVDGMFASATSRQRRLATAWLALAVGAGLLAGHIETTAFGMMAIAAYAVFKAVPLLRGPEKGLGNIPNAARPLCALALGGLLGLSLAALQLLPFAEYLSFSIARYTHTSLSGLQIAPGLWPTVAVPDAFGRPGTAGNAAFSLRFGGIGGNYNEINGAAIGLVALPLLIIGLGLGRNVAQKSLIAFGSLLAILGLALPRSLTMQTIMASLPLLQKLIATRASDWFLMGSGILVALGVQALATPGRRPLGAAAAALAAFAVVDTIVVVELIALSHQVAAGSLDYRAVEGAVLISAIAAVGMLGLGRSGMISYGARLLVLGALLASTGGLLNTYNPSINPILGFHTNATLATVDRVTGTAMTMRLDGMAMPADTNLAYGLPEPTSYDALDVSWYARLYTALEGQPPNQIEQLPACPARLRTLGIEYIETDQPLKDENWAPALRPAPVAHVGPVTVYAVPGSHEYSMVSGSTIVSDEAQAITASASCNFDTNAAVVLQRNGAGAATTLASQPSLARSSLSGNAGGVDVLQEAANSSRLVTTSATGGWLLMRRTYFPGWTATIDGRSTPIWRADGAFRALHVPAGSHLVVMEYKPGAVTAGALISAVALLVLGTLFVSGRGLQQAHQAAKRDKTMASDVLAGIAERVGQPVVETTWIATGRRLPESESTRLHHRHWVTGLELVLFKKHLGFRHGTRH